MHREKALTPFGKVKAGLMKKYARAAAKVGLHGDYYEQPPGRPPYCRHLKDMLRASLFVRTHSALKAGFDALCATFGRPVTTPPIHFVFGYLENTDGVHRTPQYGGRRTPPVSSRVGNKLPLPLYADVRLYIPMTHNNDVDINRPAVVKNRLLEGQSIYIFKRHPHRHLNTALKHTGGTAS